MGGLDPTALLIGMFVFGAVMFGLMGLAWGGQSAGTSAAKQMGMRSADVPTPLYVPGATVSCGAAKAGLANPRPEIPIAVSEAPVRSAMRRCEVVMYLIPCLDSRPRILFYSWNAPGLNGCVKDTRRSSPPAGDIPVMLAYPRLRRKAKRKS